MHCVVDWIPAFYNQSLFSVQQWIQINVDFADGIMSSISVVVQNPTKIIKNIHSINKSKKAELPTGRPTEKLENISCTWMQWSRFGQTRSSHLLKWQPYHQTVC